MPFRRSARQILYTERHIDVLIEDVLTCLRLSRPTLTLKKVSTNKSNWKNPPYQYQNYKIPLLLTLQMPRGADSGCSRLHEGHRPATFHRLTETSAAHGNMNGAVGLGSSF